jgi:hypothetical protein
MENPLEPPYLAENGAVTVLKKPMPTVERWWVGHVLHCSRCFTEFRLEEPAEKDIAFRISETLGTASFPCPFCSLRCQTKKKK